YYFHTSTSPHSLTLLPAFFFSCFFFNDTAPTEIYTLSLHDALPIFEAGNRRNRRGAAVCYDDGFARDISLVPHLQGALIHELALDRKSTRLNSSHVAISYAVFCLKKKKKKSRTHNIPVI